MSGAANKRVKLEALPPYAGENLVRPCRGPEQVVLLLGFTTIVVCSD
jgi:hypothetical protein